MITNSTERLFLSERIRNRLRHLTTRHRQGDADHVFIFSTPRSGSTWLAELIATQGRFKVVNEPFNLRRPVVRATLGFDDWALLLDPESKPAMRAYLQKFIDDEDDDPRFKREIPFSEHWHFTTDRMLFKILFAGEDDFGWFAREFGGQILLLLRHPIPVSLSREELPRLHSFLTGPFATRFTEQQRAVARSVIESANHFEMAVLDWCLQNAVPLLGVDPKWTIISYEQMVLDPDTAITHLAQRLSLPDPARMLKRLGRASASTVKSSAESRRLLQHQRAAPEAGPALIGRWRGRVTPQQEARAFDIVEAFEIDYYLRGSLTPNPKWLLSAPRRQAP
jgi:hypothetical protein